MKLTFLGATHEVTGSCTMVECGGVLGLVDCGMALRTRVCRFLPERWTLSC